MAARNVIVTGATGKQGRAFIQELLYPSNTNGSAAPTYRVWAVARDTASPAATRLLKIFAEAAAEGRIFGIFIVLPYPGLGNNGGDEERQGKTLVDLAIGFKVEALVYSSRIPPGPDVANGFDASCLAKREIELYCKSMGEKGLNWRLASEDIGKVAAGVIQNHERYTHKTVTVAGGSYTMDEVKVAYKEVMGKTMPSFPAILAWLALKLSAGVQHVIQDTERIYQARASGGYPTLEEEIESAKAVCEMQDFRTWLLKRKENV